MITYDDVQGPKMSKGVVLALLSAFFYASYLVLVKRKSDTEEKIDIPLFFGECLIFSVRSLCCSMSSDYRFFIFRIRWLVEFASDVANIFRIKFHTNRTI